MLYSFVHLRLKEFPNQVNNVYGPFCQLIFTMTLEHNVRDHGDVYALIFK